MKLPDAIIIATQVHAGEFDLGGQPYILHPLRVMLALGLDATEDERCVAVLHDVLETLSVVTDGRERAAAILGSSGRELATVLRKLTRNCTETYRKYIARLALNPTARKIKLADLEDNLDGDRLAASPTKQPESLRRRYIRARAQLQKEEDRHAT